MKTNTETSHDADAVQASTTLTTPCEVRARYEAAAQALSEALVRKRAMREHAAKMARAGEAARAQANAVCDQYRELLRQADGELTREIQKLRASERSSLTLVEEYAAMQKEIQAQVTGMELEVAELASAAMGLRNRMLELASQETFDTLMAQAGDAMAAAYTLYRRATLSSVQLQMRPSDDQVLAGFVYKPEKQIKERVGLVGEQVASAIGVRELKLDGVDVVLAGSPSRRAMLSRRPAEVAAD
ncbi:hypothetical protein [Xanthomonas arboricola]|uniref:hypothetical protein n=1 Tax=Xanthomonas arboricola TaxID=56448 RepID=UPI003EB96F21